MTLHKCNQEDRIGRLSMTQKGIIGAIALFLTLTLFAVGRADNAVEKANQAVEACGEVNVIKNDVQWIKKHLERREVKK